jgi:hypothetical protein
VACPQVFGAEAQLVPGVIPAAAHTPPAQWFELHWQSSVHAWQFALFPAAAPPQDPLQSISPLLLQPHTVP